VRQFQRKKEGNRESESREKVIAIAMAAVAAARLKNLFTILEGELL